MLDQSGHGAARNSQSTLLQVSVDTLSRLYSVYRAEHRNGYIDGRLLCSHSLPSTSVYSVDGRHFSPQAMCCGSTGGRSARVDRRKSLGAGLTDSVWVKNYPSIVLGQFNTRTNAIVLQMSYSSAFEKTRSSIVQLKEIALNFFAADAWPNEAPTLGGP